MSPRFHTAFALAASVVVVAAVAWGFILAGSPAKRRLERFDEQRLRDLQTIVREIQSTVLDPAVANPKGKGSLKAPLPTTLEEAAKSARGEKISLRDPETDEAYRYTVKNDSTYELCATFARPRDENSGVFWNHRAGAHCFTINVLDPPPYW
jgi:hypothetical protein